IRRSATLNQSATTAEGDTISIRNVIVTHHNVRVLWRVDESAQPQPTIAQGLPAMDWYACCSLKLDVGGTSIPFSYSYPNPFAQNQSPERNAVAPATLFDEQGDWTLLLSYFSTFPGNAYFPPLPGPTFHFTIPSPIR